MLFVSLKAICLWLLITTACLFECAEVSAGVEDKLADYLDAAEKHWQFQGAVLVAKDGKALLNKGYGYANRDFEEPNTPDTKFFIGSITKQFTASAVLMLQDKGRLDLQAPITKYLPDYPAETGDRVTVHNLLSHTSGIPNYTDDPQVIISRTHWISPASLIDLFKDRPLLFEPGTAFAYSNSNYILLGAIVEAVSGQSFEAFLHKNILKPARMINTGYARREAGLPDRADGYTLDIERGPTDALPMSFSILHTAGALYSTTNDLLKWDRELGDDDLLYDQSRAAMFTPNFGNYGYGWVIEERHGTRRAYHGGFLDGFNCTFDRWLDEGLCVAVLSNEDRAPVGKIARGLAAIVMYGAPYNFPTTRIPSLIDSTLLAEYEGVYLFEPGAHFLVRAGEKSLKLRSPGRELQVLLPEAVDRFFLQRDNSVIYEFTRDSTGRVAGLTFIDEEMQYTGSRLKDDGATSYSQASTQVPLTDAMCEAFSGMYHLETQTAPGSPIELVIVCAEGAMFAEAAGTGMVRIVPYSDRAFYQPDSDMTLEFLIDSASRVTGCVLRVDSQGVTGVKVE